MAKQKKEQSNLPAVFIIHYNGKLFLEEDDEGKLRLPEFDIISNVDADWNTDWLFYLFSEIYEWCNDHKASPCDINIRYCHEGKNIAMVAIRIANSAVEDFAKMREYSDEECLTRMADFGRGGKNFSYHARFISEFAPLIGIPYDKIRTSNIPGRNPW